MIFLKPIVAAILAGAFAIAPALAETRMMTHEPCYIGGRWANFSQDDIQGSGDGQMRHQISARFDAVRQTLFPLQIALTTSGDMDVDAPSAPIREQRYLPEVFLAWQNVFGADEIRTGWLHESNGQDSTQSRGWDRYYVAADFSLPLATIAGFDVTVSGTARLWWVISASGENASIGSTDVTGLLRDNLGGDVVGQLALTGDYVKWDEGAGGYVEVPYDPVIVELGGEAKGGRVTLYWNPNPAWSGYYLTAEFSRGKMDTMWLFDETVSGFFGGVTFLPWEIEE